MKTVVLVGHDNFGSREIFTEVVRKKYDSDVRFVLFVTTGLYYKKTFSQSIFKLLKEASFIFCFYRFIDGLIYKLKRDTLVRRAKSFGIETHVIADINSSETHLLIKKINADIMVSMFTMHIYTSKTISLFEKSIGTHPSILPEYRGLEVFFWMLANEESEGGVSVFLLDVKIDAGLVFLQEKFQIAPDESVNSMYEKLTIVTKRLVAVAVQLLLSETKLEFIEGVGKETYYPMPTRASFKRFRKTRHRLYGISPEKRRLK